MTPGSNPSGGWRYRLEPFTAQHLVYLLGGLLLHGRWQEQLSRLCVLRRTRSLRRHLTRDGRIPHDERASALHPRPARRGTAGHIVLYFQTLRTVRGSVYEPPATYSIYSRSLASASLANPSGVRFGPQLRPCADGRMVALSFDQ